MIRRLRFFILFLILVAAQGSLFAQYRAEFSVNSEKGCAPFTVVVTEDTDVTGSIGTQYDYGEGTGETSATSHTYNTPGTYVIVQYLQNDDADPKSISKEIEVFPAEIPEFNYYLCSGRRIFLTVNDDTYPAYFVYFENGVTRKVLPHQTLEETLPDTNPINVTVQGLMDADGNHTDAANLSCGKITKSVTPMDAIPVPAITQVEIISENSIDITYNNIVQDALYQLEAAENGSATFNAIGTPTTSGNFIAENLNTIENYYCFRIVQIDPCNNLQTPSNTICSLTSEAVAENNQNTLIWLTPSGDVQNYEIYRNNVLVSNIANPAQTSFTDTDVVCKEEYCYQITAIFENGISINNVNCVEGITNNIPPALLNTTANVFGNDVHFEWLLPEISARQFTVQRSGGDGTYETFGTTEANAFIDSDINIAENYHCYKIYYEDECGNISPESTEICPILLTIIENNDHFYELTWTQYIGWEEGVAGYWVEKFDEEGNVFESIEMPSGTNFYIDDSDNQNRQTVTYRITAISNNPAGWQSYSNAVLTNRPLKVFLPSAFTPNGDDLNDEFLAKGRYIQELEIKIFNRWGELIFYSDDKAVGWDGMYRGSIAPEGTYVYTLLATGYDGKTITQSGSFMLIRKRRN